MPFRSELAALDGTAQGGDREHGHPPEHVVRDAELGQPHGRLQIQGRVVVGGLGDLAAPLEEDAGYELVFGHGAAFAIRGGRSTATGAGSAFRVNVVPLAVPGPRQ
ncbi:hypothetical protein ASG60_08445 [Methylobacterium sp. Leaf469]|uniref:hypothetical protein n=1 Tax=Methylobacterium sp. Leaf469 TaxID=1736387 RepID=UPI0006FCFD85|nr:hypothetical protein [Methylobacterium sp. Leaf469]KQT93385.1 hypothetical protein ASG60_08445 [Methylobacterium sp. Leaf469]